MEGQISHMLLQYIKILPPDYQHRSIARLLIDMSLPCWNVVRWSKRGLAQEAQSLESSTSKGMTSDTLNFQSSSPLIRLPGDLRNRILEFCVNDATFCPRCLEHYEIVADVSRNMQIRGIGPLPLLFTNKQIHDEVVSTVYSNLRPIAINGYFLIFHQSPISFLPSLSYPAIWPHHPHVQNFARSVSITMSYWKMWGEGLGAWCDFTSDRQRSLDGPYSAINADTPFETNRAVIRKLVKYLRSSSLCLSLRSSLSFVGILWRKKRFMDCSNYCCCTTCVFRRRLSSSRCRLI
jgi:hypothetical protein